MPAIGPRVRSLGVVATLISSYPAVRYQQLWPSIAIDIHDELKLGALRIDGRRRSAQGARLENGRVGSPPSVYPNLVVVRVVDVRQTVAIHIDPAFLAGRSERRA